MSEQHLFQRGVMNLIYMMDHIPYLIFKIILSISSRNKTVPDSPPIQIYINKTKNYVVFKIKAGFRVLRLMIRVIIKRNYAIARKTRANCC